MKKLLIAILLMALACAAWAAPGEIIRPQGAKLVPGQYIVKFHDEVDASGMTRQLAWAHQADVELVFEHAFRGAVLKMDEARALELSYDPQVEFIEQDSYAHLAMVTQCMPTWGLDRIDQPNLPLNQGYNFNNTAGCVHVYVFDTGIRSDHVEFGGRVDTVNAFTAINDGWGTEDCHGHGTHVAGTIGSHTYGVAKRVTLHPLRVLDCTGWGLISGIVNAINWLNANVTFPAVANMSLGVTGGSPSLDTAVTGSIALGITYVAAAGNTNTNACLDSPGRVPAVVTVGATDQTDTRAFFPGWWGSNWGPCLDVFAPGVNITSTYNTSPTATNTMMGTSMASPHAAGVAALYLANNQAATPAQVHAAIVAGATPGVVTNPGPGSPNLLLYSIINGCP